MKTFIKPIPLFSLLLFSVSVGLATFSNSFIPSVFQGEFIKILKEKFSRFTEQTSQDRVYVQTDKTFYKPGETVWFTAYLRDEATFKPSSKSDIVHVELLTPKGSVARHYRLIAKNGLAKGDFDLSGFVGGIYKLKAYTEWQKNDSSLQTFEKELTVQQVVMPRLKMKIDFVKKAYGPGDEVEVNLQATTNENKALAKSEITFVAQLDGKEWSRIKAMTDDAGKTQFRFTLPKDLNTVDGLINALIDFDGSTESISRSIPIVLNQIDLTFYPEGGDLVSGVKTKVAFRALNEFGKAADVEGIIVDSKGAFVQRFSSFHLGMGAFDFIPKKGEQYKARITRPEGIIKEYELPDALPIGYVLNIQAQQKNKVIVRVNSFRNETLSIVARERDKIYYAQSFKAQSGDNLLTINTADFPIGVAQLTLFDSKGIARAERLLFTNKDKQLHIVVTTDKKEYQPREKVTMKIQVTDKDGLPMPGHFSLAVVDDNLLTFADDKQGNILSEMLLEPELKEKVEEPQFYFDTKEAKADEALDDLLLTAGWRRYTWKQIRENDLPSNNFQAEQTILSGTVWDAFRDHAVGGATVQLKGSNYKVVTDKEGRFELKGFDITLNNQLEISATGYQNTNKKIDNYGTDQRFNIQTRHVYYAVGLANQALDQEVMEGAMPMRAMQKKEMLVDLAKAEQQNVFADVAPVPPAPDIAPDPNNKEAVNQVGDLRSAELQKFDKDVAENNKVVFYRAKEFPQKKYTTNDSLRNDLATTVYWNGDVATDRHGNATVQFVTNDLISSFKTTIEGFGDDGSIGRAQYDFTTNQPLTLDVKIPAELVSGDHLMIPVFIKNGTDEKIQGTLNIKSPVQLKISNKAQTVIVPPHQTKLVYVETEAGDSIGDGDLQFTFVSDKYRDALNRKVSVTAKGFPANISLSGQDLNKDFYIHPVNVVPGSMKVTFTAYPSVMNELLSGIDAIIREPYGCFEQTSSSNYPNIMVLKYLKTMKINDPDLEAKAKKLLDEGYKKLTSFETKENGYEWFGAAPAHEALTAYGLMEFEDMKSVYDGVDPAMIDRTVKLLLDRRDGQGGFKKNPKALDSFGAADADITNCYIVYALTEAGLGKEISKEIEASYKIAKKSGDPYMMALMANALFNMQDTKRAEGLLNDLLALQNKEGFWTGKQYSITRSTGKSLQIETTSLVALALMKSENPNKAALVSAVKFLVGSRSGYGGFGSTQGTILALKALMQYAEFSRKTDESGTVSIWVDGEKVATKSYEKGAKGNVVIDGLEKFLKPGRQKVEVRYTDCKQALPYAMNISYHTALPENSLQSVVGLQAKWNARTVKVGETVRLTVSVTNKTSAGQAMTLAVIGIPAGLSAQPWQLKELQEKGVIDFYEIIGNNIACYYRDLAPNESKQINLDLKAELPGEYSAPATSAYLYYTNENKVWASVDQMQVTP